MICTGFLSFADFVRSANSLSARSEPGKGVTGRDPCFEATEAAEYGLLMPSKRGVEKKSSISLVRVSNWAASSSSEGGWRGRDGRDDMAFWAVRAKEDILWVVRRRSITGPPQEQYFNERVFGQEDE